MIFSKIKGLLMTSSIFLPRQYAPADPAASSSLPPQTIIDWLSHCHTDPELIYAAQGECRCVWRQQKPILFLEGLTLDIVPGEIGRYTWLTDLVLSECSVSLLPDEISKITQLKRLSITDSRELQRLPDSLIEVQSLQQLDFENMDCNDDITSQIFSLQNLTILVLLECNVKRLPECAGLLKDLQYLNLKMNCLTQLPESFSQLHSLRTLDLSLNEFTQFPDQILKLPVNCAIDFRGNNLPPEEVERVKNLLTIAGNNYPKNILIDPQVSRVEYPTDEQFNQAIRAADEVISCNAINDDMDDISSYKINYSNLGSSSTPSQSAALWESFMLEVNRPNLESTGSEFSSYSESSIDEYAPPAKRPR